MSWEFAWPVGPEHLSSCWSLFFLVAIPRLLGAILVELDGESVRVRDEGKRPSCVGIYPDRLNFDASRPK